MSNEEHCAKLPYNNEINLTFVTLTFHERHDNLTLITNGCLIESGRFDKTYNEIGRCIKR